MNHTRRLITVFALSGSFAFGGTLLNIPATTDIWLAGQASGATVTGFFGTDDVPDNSPIEFDLTGQAALVFSVTGSTSVDDSCFAGPDGGCYPDEFSFSPGPANGISLIHGPSDALVGVFLDNSVPGSNPAPAPLDFTGSLASALSISPELNQQFFIGDGLTGTSSGDVQSFVVPTGATRLFLAVADSVGGSTGNLGSLDVTVDTGSVPEPSQWIPLAGALLVLAAKRR